MRIFVPLFLFCFGAGSARLSHAQIAPHNGPAEVHFYPPEDTILPSRWPPQKPLSWGRSTAVICRNARTALCDPHMAFSRLQYGATGHFVAAPAFRANGQMTAVEHPMTAIEHPLLFISTGSLFSRLFAPSQAPFLFPSPLGFDRGAPFGRSDASGARRVSVGRHVLGAQDCSDVQDFWHAGRVSDAQKSRCLKGAMVEGPEHC